MILTLQKIFETESRLLCALYVHEKFITWRRHASLQSFPLANLTRILPCLMYSPPFFPLRNEDKSVDWIASSCVPSTNEMFVTFDGNRRFVLRIGYVRDVILFIFRQLSWTIRYTPVCLSRDACRTSWWSKMFRGVWFITACSGCFSSGQIRFWRLHRSSRADA